MAAKKSFKNSPAMQFITTSTAQPSLKPEPSVEKTPKATPQGKENSLPPFSPEKAAPKKSTPIKPPAQKGETGGGKGSTKQEAAPEFPVPMKPNPAYIETRSKRVQLLMQPSLHSKLKTLALQKDVSLNDLVHTMLEQALEHTH